tara:strand:- start:84 stop:572 length:489 start_codon:yes stop_codon:yes gene_type:complete
MWYQFAEGVCEGGVKYLAHGQFLTGIIVNVRDLLPFMDDEEVEEGNYLDTIYSIEEVTPINITGKLEWEDNGDLIGNTVGYIRGEVTNSEHLFANYKLSVNVPKLIKIWNQLKQPNSMFLAADYRGVTQVYTTQRSAIALEVLGWSSMSVTKNVFINYPRGI